jgi:hypothetical protein
MIFQEVLEARYRNSVMVHAPGVSIALKSAHKSFISFMGAAVPAQFERLKNFAPGNLPIRKLFLSHFPKGRYKRKKH